MKKNFYIFCYIKKKSYLCNVKIKQEYKQVKKN